MAETDHPHGDGHGACRPPSRRRTRTPAAAASMAAATRPPTSRSIPVCGMSVNRDTAKHRFAYKGQDYFFCSARCRERFEAEPQKFLAPKRSRQPEPAAPAGTIYTCPMHPEVRQVGPGSCPICGMALEPEQVSLDQAPDPELIDMTRRFWIALVLTLPVFAIEMGSHLGFGASRAADVVELDFLRAGDAGGAVGGRAVFRPRLALAGHAQSQHVHADRDGHRRGLGLQRGGHAGAAIVSACVPRHARHGRGVFRGGRRHHGAGPARTGAGIAGARAHLGRDPALLGLAPKTARRITDARRRGCRDRCHRGRRPPAGASGREDPGRRRRHRRPLRGR